MIYYNTLVVLLGASILGACAGLVGSFAVLRRKALTGDALAHATLPGLCLAFLILQQRSLPILLAGALISGLLGIGVITFLRRWTRIKEDAAIGLVLSVFFGAGIVFDRLIQNRTTGGSQAGLDSYILGKTSGMILQDVYLIAGLALLSLLVVLFLYKEFKLVAFDADFARAQGWPALALDLLLMGLIAVAVVIGLPAVGVVMISALLILPAAAARFWTDRLSVMLILSSLFGLTVGLVGTLISARYSRMPTGPVIVLVGTGLFLVSLLFSPRRGLLGRWLAQQRFHTDLGRRILLRVLYERMEAEGFPPDQALPGSTMAISHQGLLQARSWTSEQLRRLLRWALRTGLLQEEDQNGYHLTRKGLRRAATVARGWRLWELFLTEYPHQVQSIADLGEESVEELLPPDIVESLRIQLDKAGRLPSPERWQFKEVAR
jgi:manganese/zinc/iron transport system permease protein